MRTLLIAAAASTAASADVWNAFTMSSLVLFGRDATPGGRRVSTTVPCSSAAAWIVVRQVSN